MTSPPPPRNLPPLRSQPQSSLGTSQGDAFLGMANAGASRNPRVPDAGVPRYSAAALALSPARVGSDAGNEAPSSEGLSDQLQLRTIKKRVGGGFAYMAAPVATAGLSPISSPLIAPR